MSYRLAYGSLIMLLLAVFMLLLSLKLVPYWQTRYRFEPVALAPRALAIAWAVDRGAKDNEVVDIPVTLSGNFQFAFPYFDSQHQVEDYALKVVVKEKLPDDNYVMKISGRDDSVTLPLKRQDDGTYASSEFIALEDKDGARYFHGVRVLHVRGGTCSLAVEKVVRL